MPQPPTEKKEEYSKVQKGKVVLIFGKSIISGECRFTAVKTKKKNGEAIFTITLVKKL